MHLHWNCILFCLVTIKTVEINLFVCVCVFWFKHTEVKKDFWNGSVLWHVDWKVQFWNYNVINNRKWPYCLDIFFERQWIACLRKKKKHWKVFIRRLGVTVTMTHTIPSYLSPQKSWVRKIIWQSVKRLTAKEAHSEIWQTANIFISSKR